MSDETPKSGPTRWNALRNLVVHQARRGERNVALSQPNEQAVEELARIRQVVEAEQKSRLAELPWSQVAAMVAAENRFSPDQRAAAFRWRAITTYASPAAIRQLHNALEDDRMNAQFGSPELLVPELSRDVYAPPIVRAMATGLGSLDDAAQPALQIENRGLPTELRVARWPVVNEGMRLPGNAPKEGEHHVVVLAHGDESENLYKDYDHLLGQKDDVAQMTVVTAGEKRTPDELADRAIHEMVGSLMFRDSERRDNCTATLAVTSEELIQPVVSALQRLDPAQRALLDVLALPRKVSAAGAWVVRVAAQLPATRIVAGGEELYGLSFAEVHQDTFAPAPKRWRTMPGAGAPAAASEWPRNLVIPRRPQGGQIGKS